MRARVIACVAALLCACGSADDGFVGHGPPGFTISPMGLNLVVGDTASVRVVSATADPTQFVEWRASRSEVMTFDSVTATRVRVRAVGVGVDTLVLSISRGTEIYQTSMPVSVRARPGGG